MTTETNTAAANVFAWAGVGLSSYLNAIGIHTWGDFAAMCAAALSIVTLCDWGWKKFKGRVRK